MSCISHWLLISISKYQYVYLTNIPSALVFLYKFVSSECLNNVLRTLVRILLYILMMYNFLKRGVGSTSCFFFLPPNVISLRM